MKGKKMTISDVEVDDETKKSGKRDHDTEGSSTINEIEVEEPIETKNIKQRTKAKPKKKHPVVALLTNKKFLVLVGALLLSLFATGAILYSIFAVDTNQPGAVITFNPSYLEAGEINIIKFSPVEVAEPSEPRTKINPINGELLTETEFNEYKDRNPVAVMVNNHTAARPQSGLIYADLIYETIAESGITRYMPIFWSDPVEIVGPIRSIRQYYLEWLSEYDAIVIHDGYASSDDLRIDAGGNMWRYGTKTISTQGAWRDNTRYAPHNEYSSVLNAMEIGEQKGWTGLPSGFDSWSFGPDAPKDQRGKIDSISVVPHSRLFNGGSYNAVWEYDVDSNTFSRSIGGVPDVDREKEVQLEAKTVIIQLLPIIPSGDAKAHNIIETIGEGDAVIFMNGKRYDVEWEKGSRTERTIFKYADGTEFIFNRGLIWITGLSTTDGSFDIIEQ